VNLGLTVVFAQSIVTRCSARDLSYSRKLRFYSRAPAARRAQDVMQKLFTEPVAMYATVMTSSTVLFQIDIPIVLGKFPNMASSI
jgi:hypothetical protein